MREVESRISTPNVYFLSLITHPHVVSKTFVHLRNTNEHIFDEILSFLILDSNVTEMFPSPETRTSLK